MTPIFGEKDLSAAATHHNKFVPKRLDTRRARVGVGSKTRCDLCRSQGVKVVVGLAWYFLLTPIVKYDEADCQSHSVQEHMRYWALFSPVGVVR